MKRAITITLDIRLYYRLKDVAAAERRSLSSLCDTMFADFMEHYNPRIDKETLEDKSIHYRPKGGKVLRQIFKEVTGIDVDKVPRTPGRKKKYVPKKKRVKG